MKESNAYIESEPLFRVENILFQQVFIKSGYFKTTRIMITSVTEMKHPNNSFVIVNNTLNIQHIIFSLGKMKLGS